MTQVTLSTAEIVAALTRSGRKLGPAQFTFSIPTASSVWPGYAAGTEPFTTYSIVTAEQAAAFRAAIATWDELIGPDFTEVADDASGRGEIRVAFTSYEMDRDTGAYAYQSVPGTPGGKSGDIWINANARTESYATGYNFELMIHELGHALGLSHSFESPAIAAPFENTRYTVMSYTSGRATDVVTFTGTGGSIRASTVGATAATPMVLDIAAVQSLYGADTKTRAGDSVYTFRQDDTALRSIYDAGGIDTIDLSSFTRPNVVDLTPGAYSSIGQFSLEAQIAFWTAQFPGFATFIRNTLNAADLYTRTDNLGIALTTIIENATGGSAADTITGNAAANVLLGMGGADILNGGDGDDRLDGGAGDDVLTGGAGADVFVLRETGNDSDRITDFNVAQDRFDTGGRAFTGVAATGGGTTLYHAGGQVVLDGVFALALDAANARVIGLSGIRVTPLPADGATGVSPLADIRFVFSGAVARGSGAITLSGPDGVVESYAAGDARVRIAGSLLTIDPAASLKAGQTYTVTIAPGAVTVGGTSFEGLAGYDFATRAIDATARYQLLLSDGAGGTASGSGTVFGTRTGLQDVVVLDTPGQIVFDPSFNAGGDRIRLSGAAASYTVQRSGSTVLLNDGDSVIGIPIGPSATDIVFADGIRTLAFNTTDQTARLGTQVVSTTVAALTAPVTTAGVTGTADFAIAGQMVMVSRAAATASGSVNVVGLRQAVDPYGGASADFTSTETVRVATGARVTLDPSFNAGKDIVILPGDAATYSAVRTGSSIVLSSATESVTIPVGLGVLTVRFDDAERGLTFDGAANAVKLGTQTVATASVAVSAAGAQTTVALGAPQNAATGDYRYTHAGDLTPGATVTGFGRGDSVVLQGSADRYVFGGTGGDVTLGYIGSDGVLRTTVFSGLADPALPIHDRASAEAAVGFGFIGA